MCSLSEAHYQSLRGTAALVRHIISLSEDVIAVFPKIITILTHLAISNSMSSFVPKILAELANSGGYF